MTDPRPRTEPQAGVQAGVQTGVLTGDLAYLKLGHGAPLVVLPGLSTDHDLPTGFDRWFELQQLRRYAAVREAWWVQRPRHLPAGTTMARIAERYAEALRDRFAGPVDVVGVSTGGSVALQLAADHPATVRRLALVSSACRLGPEGRLIQRRIAEELRAGRRCEAGALLMSVLAVRPVSQRALRSLGWLTGPVLMGGDVADMLVTIDAEDAFDLTDRLAEITTPTLVVGGTRDRFYGEALVRETADGLADGRALVLAGKGHAGAISSTRTVEAVLLHTSPPPD